MFFLRAYINVALYRKNILGSILFCNRNRVIGEVGKDSTFCVVWLHFQNFITFYYNASFNRDRVPLRPGSRAKNRLKNRELPVLLYKIHLVLK